VLFTSLTQIITRWCPRPLGPRVKLILGVGLCIICTISRTSGRWVCSLRHRLIRFSPAHALRALKQYIVQRLLPETFRDKTENAIVSFVWMALESNAIPADIETDLTLFHQIWNSHLECEAAHAVFLMLWKRITAMEANASPFEVLQWCSLVSNPLLENCGEKNVCKIQRKMIMINLNIPDVQAAKEVISKMSAKVRQQPMSLYLAYMVALRCRDEGPGTCREYLHRSAADTMYSRDRPLVSCQDTRQGSSTLARLCW
jgi:hypothetical protein